jgi:hypothetical protein
LTVVEIQDSKKGAICVLCGQEATKLITFTPDPERDKKYVKTEDFCEECYINQTTNRPGYCKYNRII